MSEMRNAALREVTGQTVRLSMSGDCYGYEMRIASNRERMGLKCVRYNIEWCQWKGKCCDAVRYGMVQVLYGQDKLEILYQ